MFLHNDMFTSLLYRRIRLEILVKSVGHMNELKT